MLLYTYKVDNTYTLQYLSEIFHELLLHNKFNHKSISNSALNEYGIQINSFAPGKAKSSIFNNSSTSLDKSDDTPNQSTTTEFSNKANEIVPDDNSFKEESSLSKQNPNAYTCPKCGHVTKFKTTYCIRCGETLSDN